MKVVWLFTVDIHYLDFNRYQNTEAIIEADAPLSFGPHYY